MYYLPSFSANTEKQKSIIKFYGMESVWFSPPVSESTIWGQNSDNLSAVFVYFEITSIEVI